RVALVTARFPHGPGEAFLIDEVRVLSSRFGLAIFPMLIETRKAWHPVHQAKVIALPLISAEIIWGGLRELLRRPLAVFRTVLRVVLADLRPNVVLKNVAVIPKG